jgi:hypothetical protein
MGTSSAVYTLYKGHKSFQSLWDEWYGQHQFSPLNNDTITHTGGKAYLEQHKPKWRKEFSEGEAQLFSRTKYLIDICNSKLTPDKANLTTVLEQMNLMFKQHGCSVHSLTKGLTKESRVAS